MNSEPNILPWGASALQQGVAALWRGGVVIYPTETFYALGALPSRPQAIARLLAIKQRTPSPNKALPLIAADRAAVTDIATLPAPLAQITDEHWPGPLTVCLMPDEPRLWRAVAATDGSVGVRISSHPAALALAAGADPALLVATSANQAGAPPAQEIAALCPEILRAVDLVIDAGKLAGGAPSTVVGLDEAAKLRVVRQGAVTLKAVARLAG